MYQTSRQLGRNEYTIFAWEAAEKLLETLQKVRDND